MVQGEIISKLSDYGVSMANSIRGNDPRISPSVSLTFLDGSKSIIAQAYTEVDGDWLYVVSMGDGYYLYNKGDLLQWTPQSIASATEIGHKAVAHGLADFRSRASV